MVSEMHCSRAIAFSFGKYWSWTLNAQYLILACFITSIFYSETGIWSCTVNAEGKQDSDNFQLLVEPQLEVSVRETFKLIDKAQKMQNETLVLNCTANKFYSLCSFEHNQSICHQKCDSQTCTFPQCNDTRISFIGDPQRKSCSIKIKSFKKEDYGNWACLLESYHEDSNSPNTNIMGTIYVDAEKKISQLGTFAIQITVACIFGITILFGIISYLLLKYCS